MKCITHKNDAHVNNTDNLDIIMLIYSLIDYSDNYSDSSGSLRQFKREEQSMNNRNAANVNTSDSSSFKYKSSFF